MTPGGLGKRLGIVHSGESVEQGRFEKGRAGGLVHHWEVFHIAGGAARLTHVGVSTFWDYVNVILAAYTAILRLNLSYTS